MTDLVPFFDPQKIEAWRSAQRQDPERLRRFRNRMLKHFDEDLLHRLPPFDQLRLHDLKWHDQRDSEIDGATKLLFRTDNDLLIESVILRIASGRNTLCVSSQVGCAAACSFCATGKMGIAQNLTAGQIVDQVFQCGQILATEGRRLKNIVFMGMGEPFHNQQHLFAALDLLTCPKHFDRSPASLLVSTVGIPDGMQQLVQRFPKVNLALSLHSANQAVRETIIPLASTYPLDQLHQTLKQINKISDKEIMLEYLMLKDVNDSLSAAEELLTWARNLNCHINLIPFNSIEGSDLQSSDETTIQTFANYLKTAGQKTTIRYSLGSDVAAACGQLVRMENRKTRAQTTALSLPHSDAQ